MEEDMRSTHYGYKATKTRTWQSIVQCKNEIERAGPSSTASLEMNEGMNQRTVDDPDRSDFGLWIWRCPAVTD